MVMHRTICVESNIGVPSAAAAVDYLHILTAAAK